jgi:hypothetical protein
VEMIDQPQQWTAYVNAWSTLAAAAAAVAVAIFAYLEVRRARAADRAREQAANFRVSNRAYALRRQIALWTMKYPEDEGGDPQTSPEVAKPPVRWAFWVQKNFHTAEKLMTNLLEGAAEASPAVVSAVRSAYVRFYRGTARINEACDSTAYLLPVSSARAKNAQVDFAGCVLDLTTAIDPGLNEVEGRIVLSEDAQTHRPRRRPPAPT